FKQARLMGREPELLTRRKDLRFANVRLLERYEVEAQVLCIRELAVEIDVDQIAYIE
ncbi:flagellar biosynthesis protein FlhA, partial [Bacillus cereus]|nr:flagellar biosynthesis protein FlhA [Bacillus cereus]